MEQQLLKITDICKSYHNHAVLNKVNFTVGTGEIIALVGKNGQGKSTLIKIITQLIKADSGEVWYQNHRKIDRNQIAVMPQQSQAIAKITVKEAINLARSFYHQPLAYEKIMALANLADYANTKMTSLSGGQLRRLQFALTFAGNPQVVFLDEPTVGMDRQSRQKLWQAVMALKQAGTTFVITSHYLEELATIANRFIVLHNHQVVFDGDYHALQKQFNQTQIKFKSSLPLAKFKQLAGVEHVASQGEWIVVASSDETKTLKALMPFLSQMSELAITAASLEKMMDTLTHETEE